MPRKCAPGVICIENMTLFVLVAIFIPIFPAKAEKNAPKIKATTINICVVGTMNEIPASTILARTTKIANKRYSAFKNAKAPS